MSRNSVTRDRDGDWERIHARLAPEDAKRRLELDAACNRAPAECLHCGEPTQTRPGTKGYCWRPPCQRERRRVEYQRARARGESVEDSRC